MTAEGELDRLLPLIDAATDVRFMRQVVLAGDVPAVAGRRPEDVPADRLLELEYLHAIACGLGALVMLQARRDDEVWREWRDF